MEEHIKNVICYFREGAEDRLSITDVALIKKRMINDLNRLTRSYELYITSFIEEQDIDKRVQDIDELSIDRVLSFNYSDTYEKWYGMGNTNIEYDYIHGKASLENDIDTCNMVLGIEEYLEEPERTNDNYFIEFKKFYQRIYKQTGSNYLSWIEANNAFYEANQKAKPTKINIYFYGHSLAVTDGDIIARLIRHKYATTTIYYHSKKALRDQIANLVKILGEEELIQRTGDYRPSIIFKPCKEE
ncbi:AbiH family protein [Butyrivibrio sp. INlla16]|uniref:AbiH family protein n=1 Tax=Butyrivibrio sp. INlla16 TaxID=1520807 RepID=UPI00088D04E7|nr:AbiH family protein [Butyrivibrio sp. INlla16]SDB68484.1 Bacteriophage abortive infection AbiH [Butyrivibrio sp. INlla16]